MRDFRLTQNELDIVRDEIIAYLEGVDSTDTNFTVQLAMPGENRFLMVNLIINSYGGEKTFWIIQVHEISEDEYLDIYSDSNKNL